MLVYMFGYSSRWSLGKITLRWDIKFGYCQQGFEVGAARSRAEPGYLAGAGAVTLALLRFQLQF